MKEYELLKEFIECLDMEIKSKTKKPTITKLINGIRTQDSVYQFNIGKSFQPDSPATIMIKNEKGDFISHSANIISSENDVLQIEILNIGDVESIISAKLTVDETNLLKAAKEAIINLSNEKVQDHAVANKVFDIDKINSDSRDVHINIKDNKPNPSQISAIKQSLGSDVTYIWGPPGTGKSATLGIIAEKLLNINKTILITAHTNEAVDGLMEKIIELFPENTGKEEIIRWKKTQSKELLRITPSEIVSKQMDIPLKTINDLVKRNEKYKIELLNINNTLGTYDELMNIDFSKSKSIDLYNKSIIRTDMLLIKRDDIEKGIVSLDTWFNSYSSKFFMFKIINKKNYKIKTAKLVELKDMKSAVQSNLEKSKILNAELRSCCIQQSKYYIGKLNEFNNKNISSCSPESLLENKTSIEAKINYNLQRIDKYEMEIKKLVSSSFGIELLKNARVVGMTLTAATNNKMVQKLNFDVIIVDELSMAPCPSLYATCCLGKEKAILCGDFYQLSPISSCDTKWLSKSIFDNRGITEKISNGERLAELAILDTQFRTHPTIANSILDIVYKGMLKNGLPNNHKMFYAQDLEPFPKESCVLIDVSSSKDTECWCVEEEGKGWINKNSAQIAIDLTKQALKSGIKSIGIITPYKGQAKYIKSKLKELGELEAYQKVEAATVHKYQGREMDMIIFDLIDSPGKKALAPFLTGEHGTESMRLINVATTRAKGKLVVIASVPFIEIRLKDKKNSILYQWLQYLKVQHCVTIKEYEDTLKVGYETLIRKECN
ncbi:AAA domain-containing protein [Clostridium estertheticum]|uniref:DEAD/DEAH box helicase n=1 Tax=Clostridium estertheticum TaxID=238834 RepID=UPI001CF2A986|nr:AAA domain-containing protein [Clostridium estertheticum]MCB2305617.1 AAA domain-containing protein [Clostridium estertheticum]MCB2344567.1 AAA domain-containing protein [Clostridium estertheticum]MCB2347973.1 AAA domain-containing protein [Clostridium estertheticum]WAG45617.1 AAA domain-containing protein [Clostridium estertheticum]